MEYKNNNQHIGMNEIDIEDIHQKSCDMGQLMYTDPKTGLSVFTKLYHTKRGYCCGNKCRHCPYNWKNVKSDRRSNSKNLVIKD